MFESAKLKLKRAERHIGEMEAEIAAYIATKPHRFSIQNNPETGQPDIRIRFVGEPPQHLSLIIGDAIHNMRSALDHLTWEIVGVDHGTQDRYLVFPLRDSKASFESACAGIKTPSQWVRDAHVATGAFPSGKGSALYALHILDNADKHHVITPVLRGTVHPDFKILNPDGTVQQHWSGNKFIGGTADYFNIAPIPPGCSLELEDDAKCTPEIFFRNVRGPDGGSIGPTLKCFVQKILETIRSFESAVSANP